MYVAPVKLTSEGRQTGVVCDMTLDNIVDLFVFDAQDTFSCPNHCSEMPDCQHYTSYINNGLHKCFIFEACSNPEECQLCETLPKP